MKPKKDQKRPKRKTGVKAGEWMVLSIVIA
jgi:hypothetical protein